ncbi:MAG: aminotransferase class V-fold PLP-dependent enzyme [Promethearchaeota archaeon]
MNDDNWDIIREENFPSLKENIHLKAAGGSPLSRPAYEAGIKYFNDMYNHGDIFWEDYFKELSDIKKTIAQYINCRDNEIAFLINTSSCINTISRLFKKCNLIYPEGEFPASVHAFKKRGYNCFKLPKGKDYTYSLDTLENIIKRKEIKIQVHSHIQYLTGFRQDLHELGKICLRNDVLNVINATQSFGAFPIDVKNENIDVLVASGLKWLCCGYGIGILYLKSKHALENELPFTSWLSVKTALDMDNNNIDVTRK